jgi:hypothetical protein
MRRFPGLPRPLSITLKVLLLLALVDYWVSTSFVSSFIIQRYVLPFPLIRDRTSGRNTAIFFEALERVPRPRVRIGFVGDSTMNSADGFDQTFVPFLARTELRQRFPRLNVETVDASLLGLYGSSAALFVTKLLGRGTDVIVYGVTPRAFPSHPNETWVSTVSSELDTDDIGRLWRSGAAGWLLQNVSAEELLGGVVKSGWQTYTFRSQVRQLLAERLLWGDLRRWATTQEPPPTPVTPRKANSQPFEWTRSDYGLPNPNWEALDAIGRLCRRYASGRCLLYASPINPLRRETLSEPGLYEEYVAELRVVAGRYGLIFRDYTDTLTAADFRKPRVSGRDPIHMNPQGRAKLAKLLLEPLTVVLERMRVVPATSRS